MAPLGDESDDEETNAANSNLVERKAQKPR